MYPDKQTEKRIGLYLLGCSVLCAAVTVLTVALRGM